jgi:2'-hydroxyisoflavone reductase
MPSRRTFLQRAAGLAGAMGIGSIVKPSLGASTPIPREANREQAAGHAAKSLDILIIGGTGFTGPEQVEHALARGHRVTLLNRNQTRPDLFKGKVEQLIGDLSADVSALKGKRFDAVLDIPTTFPFWVRNVAQYLEGHVGHYVFISTESVYPDDSKPGFDETEPLTPMPPGLDPYTLNQGDDRRYYGALKTFSEGLVEKHYPGINTIIRPGLIVGPLDRSDRFTYWPARIDRGGEVMAPGNPTDPVQFIDSRDLAEWTIRMIEERNLGAYNAHGPAQTLTIAELLYGIKAVTTAGAQFTWVPADFLRAQRVSGWRDMPVWIAPEGRQVGFSQRSSAKAVAKGLTFRPLAVTAKDTLDWNKTRPEAEQKSLEAGAIAGISAARETEVLAAWKAKRQASIP